ncbi:hypothetical protein CRE_16185 [Caenorhabditis remanei]|uniref:Uncharacterized protein n=1 Tax=Caenorhabditis remanei TaxID=31234 RepID=E3MSG9_CAERE|nr:hypothetical protein CRE_16185 [Caenorhabditis remanei]
MGSSRKSREDLLDNFYLKDEEKMKAGDNRLKQGDVQAQCAVDPDVPNSPIGFDLKTRHDVDSSMIYSPLDKAKLAAETIVKMTRELSYSKNVHERKRALDRISVELTIIREATNGIDGKNIVDQEKLKRYIEMRITEHIALLEQLLHPDSNLHFEISSHRLLKKANKLKDQLSDLSMEFHRAVDNKEVFKTSIESTATSTPVIMEISPCSHPQNLFNPQEVLEKFCNDVIQFSKQQFKSLKLSNTDGSKAYVLSHFLKIESDILNFQMRTALESLNSPDSELKKPIFDQITSEISRGNQKVIKPHLESMKRAKEEMNLLKSIGSSVSTAANVITELAFWVLSFQNSNEKLLSMGIEPILGEKYQSNGETIPNCSYETSMLMENIETLRVIDYKKYIEEEMKKKKQWQELFEFYYKG